MLTEVDSKVYNQYFPFSPHPYISHDFIELNKAKADKIVRLVIKDTKVSIGLVAGIKEGVLKSPFSAPFGGFHFKNDNIYVSEIESFIEELVKYMIPNSINRIELTLPPSIYHLSFNSKVINALIRQNFKMKLPEITNWIDLVSFIEFTNKSAKKYLKQASKHNLNFQLLNDTHDKLTVFEIICLNRSRFGRPIYMKFNDLMNVNDLWPVDFFGVRDFEGSLVAGGVFYRGHKEIVQGIFWGDSEEGRPLRAIDFLAYKIWNYYKECGFKAIDLGISTEEGIPNEGLLRFKESHNSFSSLRFGFYFDNVND